MLFKKKWATPKVRELRCDEPFDPASGLTREQWGLMHGLCRQVSKDARKFAFN